MCWCTPIVPGNSRLGARLGRTMKLCLKIRILSNSFNKRQGWHLHERLAHQDPCANSSDFSMWVMDALPLAHKSRRGSRVMGKELPGEASLPEPCPLSSCSPRHLLCDSPLIALFPPGPPQLPFGTLYKPAQDHCHPNNPPSSAQPPVS